MAEEAPGLGVGKQAQGGAVDFAVGFHGAVVHRTAGREDERHAGVNERLCAKGAVASLVPNGMDTGPPLPERLEIERVRGGG